MNALHRAALAELAGDDLVLAIPKGRVLEQLVGRFEAAGLDPSALTKKSRKLVRTDPNTGMRFLLLKPDDVPTYVEYGVADLGIVGRDVLLEREYDLYSPLDLGIGICNLAVAGLPSAPYPPPPGVTLRVGTKYPNVATRHFAAKGLPVETIFIQGSVELAPLTGLAHVIVDIVETGETLRQNGLVVHEEVAPVSAVVVANRVGFKTKLDRIRPFLERFGEG